MNGEGPAKRAVGKTHELADGDDLLRGTAERKLGGFYAITFGASLLAWDLAFEFGAHRTVFYYRRQELFALSFVVLLSALLLRRRVHTHLWVLLFFLPPLAFQLARLVLPRTHGTVVATVVDVLAVATIAVVPVVAAVVLRLLAPDYFTLPGRRLKVSVVAIVATVALLGFLVGRFNDHFLTCEDFIVAGENPARNCTRVEP